jgi:hypothetical protein
MYILKEAYKICRNKNRKGLSQMKDAPIEDRRQGNVNDEHKLPESINKSAKKSENLTTKSRQSTLTVKHMKSVKLIQVLVIPQQRYLGEHGIQTTQRAREERKDPLILR